MKQRNLQIRRVSPARSTELSHFPIMLVGEAFGQDEDKVNIPFVGRAGKLLNECLGEAGIKRSQCYVTNVFMTRPPNNNVMHFFATRTDQKIGVNTSDFYRTPFFNNSLLRYEYDKELKRLHREINLVRPRVVVCLGRTALWAVTGYVKISALIGSWTSAHSIDVRYRVRPVWHPAYVMRQPGKRDELVEDFKKVEVFSKILFPRIICEKLGRGYINRKRCHVRKAQKDQRQSSQ